MATNADTDTQKDRHKRRGGRERERERERERHTHTHTYTHTLTLSLLHRLTSCCSLLRFDLCEQFQSVVQQVMPPDTLAQVVSNWEREFGPLQ